MTSTVNLLAENQTAAGSCAHRLDGCEASHAACEEGEDHEAHEYAAQKLSICSNSC